MRRSKIVTLALTAAASGALALAPSIANAAPGDTTATFSLTGGGLAITVPASTVNLGSAATGAANFTGSLGTVSVSDTRGALTATWTSTVASTSFTTGTATANETVANSNIAYSSGAGTSGAGQVGAFAPSVSLTLAAPGVAGAWAGTGNNDVSWNPTLVFTLLPSQVVGTYTGTVTHSVA